MTLKSWKWIAASVIIISLFVVQTVGPKSWQEKLDRFIYHSDDFLYMRAFIYSFKEENQLVPVVYMPKHKLISMENAEDGFIVEIDQSMIRAQARGIILYTGNTKHLGNVMTVYYDDAEVKVTYGMLGDIEQYPFTLVYPEYILATLKSSNKFFLSVEKNGRMLEKDEVERWLIYND